MRGYGIVTACLKCYEAIFTATPGVSDTARAKYADHQISLDGFMSLVHTDQACLLETGRLDLASVLKAVLKPS